MRWVKHMTATAQDEKIARLIADHGHAGYGLWWLVVEAVAARLEGGSDPSVTYPVTKWSHLLSLRGSHVRQALLKLEVTHLVTVEWIGSDIKVTIPNLLKYRDEYSRKSGHTHDNVGSKKQNTETETDTDTESILPSGKKQPEVDPMIQAFAERIHGRHPPVRRCSVKVVATKLKTILKGTPRGKWEARLTVIDRNHEGWCNSPEWKKENGSFAKGLENWLAPALGRFDVEPPLLFCGDSSEPRRLMF